MRVRHKKDPQSLRIWLSVYHRTHDFQFSCQTLNLDKEFRTSQGPSDPYTIMYIPCDMLCLNWFWQLGFMTRPWSKSQGCLLQCRGTEMVWLFLSGAPGACVHICNYSSDVCVCCMWPCKRALSGKFSRDWGNPPSTQQTIQTTRTNLLKWNFCLITLNYISW